jgi:hypothetical protein
MAAEVIHLGPVGQGLVMKLINNMLAQVGRIAVIEALVLGAKAGLDPQTMVDVIGRSTGNSVAFQYTAPRVATFAGVCAVAWIPAFRQVRASGIVYASVRRPERHRAGEVTTCISIAVRTMRTRTESVLCRMPIIICWQDR